MINFTDSIVTNQVSGRTVILKTHSGHLLKPIERNSEAEFYSVAPSTLRAILPEFFAFHTFSPELMAQIEEHLEEAARENVVKAELFTMLLKKVRGRKFIG